MSWPVLFAVVCGGGVGTLCRYGVYLLLPQPAITGLPVATLTVNVLGSLLMGLAYVAARGLSGTTQLAATAVITGFLGAFTTFSTFALDNVKLLTAGRCWLALVNTVANVVLCVFAAYAAVSLAEWGKTNVMR